jgi:hypothetical protein
MAFNRFSRRTGLTSTFVPKEYTPNFELLAKAMQNQQVNYDIAGEMANKTPEFREADRQGVLDYGQGLQEGMNKVTEAYKKDGIQGGNVARRAYMNQVKQDYSTTGKATGFQNNFESEKQYLAELKQGVATGRITPETYKAAVARSNESSGTSYGEDGEFNAFEGYQTAEDIDLISHIDKNLKGWLSDTLSRKVGTTYNGSYYYTDTNEAIPREEILNAVKLAAQTDPKARAYLQQQDDLFDQRDKTMSNSDKLINNAMNVLASKYDGVKSTRQFHMNYMARDRASRAAKAKADKVQRTDTGTKRSTPYNSRMGLQKIEIGQAKNKAIEDIKEQIHDLKGAPQTAGTQGPSIPLFITPAQQKKIDGLNAKMKRINQHPEEASKAEIDFYNSPQGRDEHPMMGYVLDNMSKDSVVDKGFKGVAGVMAQEAGWSPTRAENNQEVLARASKLQNALVNHLSQVTTVVRPLSDTGYKTATDRYLAQGQFKNMSASYINNANGPSPVQSVPQILHAAGIKQINGVDLEDASPSDYAAWAKNAVSFNGYMMPGPKVVGDAFELPTGLEMSINLGGNNAPITLLLDDANDEQKKLALQTQRFATTYYSPQEAVNPEIAQLPLYESDGEGNLIRTAESTDPEGWGAEVINLPGGLEVISHVHPNLINDPTLKPIVFELVRTPEGEVAGLRQSALTYDRVIRDRSDMDDRARRLVTSEKIK